MAQRWRYTADDLAEIRQAAKDNFPAVRSFVAWDEKVFGQCVTRDDFNRAYYQHIARGK